MTDIATHVRIFDADPEDDLVAKRAAAIKDLATRHLKSREVRLIFQTGNDLALAVETKTKVPEALRDEVEAAVRDAGAEAFVASEQPLQVTVCGLLGALHALEGARPASGEVTTSTVLAVGLWSALSFQTPRAEPKLEALRAELMKIAREHVIACATSSRVRLNVPDPNIPVAEPFDAGAVAKSVTTGLKSVLGALRSNAAIDREEIDLLWWVLGDWSDILERRFSGRPDSIATALASGIEVGRMLRRMPGDAHRNLTLRQINSAASLSLAEVLSGLGNEREPMAALYSGNTMVTSCPAVFPLLTALTTGSAVHAKNKSKRKVSEWAERALLESAALHVTSLPPVTV